MTVGGLTILRLWSIHPQYLDQQGLTALWREGLLAQKVLKGETRGYRNHPQLIRFLSAINPLAAIGYYLIEVNKEAERRGYNFDCSKIAVAVCVSAIEVNQGQINYEFGWLLNKIRVRHPNLFQTLQSIENPQPHPLFKVVPGGVASWEKTK